MVMKMMMECMMGLAALRFLFFIRSYCHIFNYLFKTTIYIVPSVDKIFLSSFDNSHRALSLSHYDIKLLFIDCI